MCVRERVCVQVACVYVCVCVCVYGLRFTVSGFGFQGLGLLSRVQELGVTV
jgi:hypothetical protein